MFESWLRIGRLGWLSAQSHSRTCLIGRTGCVVGCGCVTLSALAALVCFDAPVALPLGSGVARAARRAFLHGWLQ